MVRGNDRGGGSGTERTRSLFLASKAPLIVWHARLMYGGGNHGVDRLGLRWTCFRPQHHKSRHPSTSQYRRPGGTRVAAAHSPGARGPGLSVTTTTFVTLLQSLASRSLHMAARSAQMEPPMVLDSAFVPAVLPAGNVVVFALDAECFTSVKQTNT